MNNIQLACVLSYSVMTGYFCINWLAFSSRRAHSSPEEHFLSLLMLFVSTILWPLIIALSLGEFLRTRKLELSAVVPLIVAVSAFSIVLYMK